ncbi:thioredoxin-like protein [Pholiota conissans]|uniref:Thioredoxin-like protein n=1 Tax=Pholiota conissans TaxID=109636 RepID=A0A9P5Z1Y5_9AGAR|nr:thioredoxin-like protein [Pholiota conissans]
MAVQYARDSLSQIGYSKPIRRRRTTTFFLVLLVGTLFFVPWELPSSFQDLDLSGISRSNVVQLMKSKKEPVQEIYGLLHLVTEDHEQEHVLSNAVHLDPTVPLDLSVYAAGDTTLDWQMEQDTINKEYPVIVFSKTYCPHSRRAKELLKAYELHPPPKIIEVDLRDDGNMIKHLLTRLTRHSTFPNILVGGKSIGGSDNLHALHADKSLKRLLGEAGAVAHSKTSQ